MAGSQKRLRVDDETGVQLDQCGFGVNGFEAINMTSRTNHAGAGETGGSAVESAVSRREKDMGRGGPSA
jgi:hypothetical protein